MRVGLRLLIANDCILIATDCPPHQVHACGAPPRRTEQKRAMEDSFKSSAASDAGCSTVASSVYDPAQAMKTDD